MSSSGSSKTGDITEGGRMIIVLCLIHISLTTLTQNNNCGRLIYGRSKMNLHSQPTPSLRRVRKRVHERLHKRVHFKPYSDLEDVRMIENRESLQQHHHHRRDSSQQENTLFHHNQIKGDQAINLEGVPSLFRCKSREEIVNVIKTGKGAIADVFRGYNALHWYCNAKSTSLGIIQELLHRGIDINAVDQRTRTRGPIIRHTALGYACRNANIKAVRTLLQNGADPCGLGTSAQLMGLPKQGVHSNQIVYPSSLQELLCQPTNGPRPGRCPWIYHLSEADEEEDSYLDEDETAPMTAPYVGTARPITTSGSRGRRPRRRRHRRARDDGQTSAARSYG